MNRYQFIGHLGGDAQTKALKSGNVIGFSVAVTEKWRDKEGVEKSETTWVRCSYFRRENDSMAITQYLKKGTRVLVEGKPKATAYADKDQYAAASLDVTVANIELLGSPTDNANAASGATGERPKVKPANASNDPFHPDNDSNASNDASDDLPF